MLVDWSATSSEAMLQDSPGSPVSCKGSPADDPQELRRNISRLLACRRLPLTQGKGNLRWTARLLVLAAILLSFADAAKLKDRFAWVCRTLGRMFPSRRRCGATAEGFISALAKRSAQLLGIVAGVLRCRVRQIAGDAFWKIGRWVVLGVDGSRFECPMTAANEEGLGTAGKKNTGPQQMVTVIFHVATGLIWSFLRGPARDAERTHLRAMLQDLPKRAMLLADAGFVGYELMRTVIDSGRQFIIRAGGNAHLLKGGGHLGKALGGYVEVYKDIVWLWPAKQQKKRQPPLVLRLISITDGRNRRIHLLSSVLDPARLSDAEAIDLYKKRWGVELVYRSLKQTMGRRRMLCRSPNSAAAELDWTIVGLWVLGLLSIDAIVIAGKTPHRWSVAASLRVVRQAAERTDPLRRRIGQSLCFGQSLSRRLADAVKDEYVREASRKKSRHWPHRKRDQPPGDPIARTAGEFEIRLANELARGGAWN